MSDDVKKIAEDYCDRINKDNRIMELATKYGYHGLFATPDKKTLDKWIAHMFSGFSIDDRSKYMDYMNTLLNAYENNFDGIDKPQLLYDDTMAQIKCDDKMLFMTLVHCQVNIMMIDRATKEVDNG